MSGYYKDARRYEDILNLPHHQSERRPHMSLQDRAAQFAPFAALSGHEEAIEETARFTEEQRIMDEGVVENINEKLYELAQCIGKRKRVAITYFRPDTRKNGGGYLTDVGTIRKIEPVEKVVVMDSGMRIAMEQIVALESDVT